MINSHSRIHLLVLALSVFAGITSAVLCWIMLGAHPHVADELSYLFQGRILSEGKLWIPEPAIPKAFTSPWDHILRESRKWRSMYPPGWPILLAAGWILHATWLINPLLLCLSAIGVFKFAQELYDTKTGIIAIIGFVASPFVLLQSAGFMSHPSTLLFSVWCLFYFQRGKKNDALKAGISGACAFAVRPYSAVFFLLPAVFWYFFKSPKKKDFIRELLTGSLPVFALFCIYNYLLFGHIYKTGYAYDPDARFRGSLQSHFLENVPWYLTQLSKSMWGWPWPDLLIFLPLLIPREGRKKDLMLVTCFASLLCAYSVFYYRDIVYSGPRYVYEAAGILAILASRSILTLPRKPALIAPLLFLIPFFLRLPNQIRYHREGYHGQPHQLIESVNRKGIAENALILISGDPFVYRTFFLENAMPPEQGSRVFAKDIPSKRREIVDAYPRQEVWIMTIHLQFLNGVNTYRDRARIEKVEWEMGNVR